MNRIEKNIQGFSKDSRFKHHLKSSKELLEVQLCKVAEIEKYNNIKMPEFVKDGIIDVFKTNKKKWAFMYAESLRYKPAKWLIDSNVISILYVFANGKPATYKINNMPVEWVAYSDFKKEGNKRNAEIIEKTFKDGMSIFN